MGDAAELLLEGVLCVGCSTPLLGPSPAGFPEYCSEACALEHGVVPDEDDDDDWDEIEDDEPLEDDEFDDWDEEDEEEEDDIEEEDDGRDDDFYSW